MSTSTQIVPSPIAGRRLRWTIDEFQRLVDLDLVEERYYLWDGEIVEAMSKKRPHRFVENVLMRWTMEHFDGHDRTMMADAPLRILGSYLPQPDLMIVAGNNEEYGRRDPEAADVLLLIEVAETSYEDDAGVKLEVYARANIPLYWIVNLLARRVEVYREPDPASGRYAVREDFDSGGGVTYLGQTLAVDALFRGLGG